MGKIDKDLLTRVDSCIKAFRKVYKKGYITSEVNKESDGVFCFKTSIGFNEGLKKHELASYKAYEKEGEDIKNFELIVIGKALELAGFSQEEAEKILNSESEQEEYFSSFSSNYVKSRNLLKALSMLLIFLVFFSVFIFPIFTIGLIMGTLTTFSFIFRDKLTEKVKIIQNSIYSKSNLFNYIAKNSVLIIQLTLVLATISFFLRIPYYYEFILLGYIMGLLIGCVIGLFRKLIKVGAK